MLATRASTCCSRPRRSQVGTPRRSPPAPTRVRRAAGRPPGAEPARSVDCAARCVRQGAGSAPAAPAARPDVRRHRLEPAAAYDVEVAPALAHHRAARRRCRRPTRRRRRSRSSRRPRSATCCPGARRGAPDAPTRRRRAARPDRRRGLHGRRPRLSNGHRDRPLAENPADLAATLSRWSPRHRADVVAIDSALREAGISLGSNETALPEGAARAAGVGHADISRSGPAGRGTSSSVDSGSA